MSRKPDSLESKFSVYCCTSFVVCRFVLWIFDISIVENKLDNEQHVQLYSYQEKHRGQKQSAIPLVLGRKAKNQNIHKSKYF